MRNHQGENTRILSDRGQFAEVLQWTADRYGDRALAPASGGVWDRRAQRQDQVEGEREAAGRVRRGNLLPGGPIS